MESPSAALEAPLAVPRQSQGSPRRPPRAPYAGPKEAKNIDFPLVFDRFSNEVFFRGNGEPKKRDGSAAKVRRRAAERPKIEGLAEMPVSSS